MLEPRQIKEIQLQISTADTLAVMQFVQEETVSDLVFMTIYMFEIQWGMFAVNEWHCLMSVVKA